MKQTTNKQLLIIALKLLVICSVVAVIVAGVNALTKERIAQNNLLNTASALDSIYSKQYGGNKFVISNDKSSAFVMQDKDGNPTTSCKIADTQLLADVSALYIINNSQGVVDGYCVAISPMGFKDKVNMLVAINSDLTVKSVKIVSSSETKGIGTKVEAPDFLNKFIGISNTSGIDTISGATKTSSPVINAVETAIAQVSAYSAVIQNGGDAQ